MTLPVDARVAVKLRSKIWNKEFIVFGSLLANPVRDGKLQLTVQNIEGDLSPSLAIELLAKPRKRTSIDTWLQAFHIFVGVYAIKYPTEVPSLVKYGETIRDLAAMGHNWHF